MTAHETLMEMGRRFPGGRWPRSVAKALAETFGYFWLPCPCCGKRFAGFEWGTGPFACIPTDDPAISTGVCPDCEAMRRRASS